MGTASASTTTFAFSFIDSQEPTTPNTVYTGTLTLEPADGASVAGTVQIDHDLFPQPIAITGTASAGYEDTGTLVNASGSSADAQINLSCIYVSDGSAGGGDDTLLGGMVSLYTAGAQEWNPYIIQGVSPQF